MRKQPCACGAVPPVGLPLQHLQAAAKPAACPQARKRYAKCLRNLAEGLRLVAQKTCTKALGSMAPSIKMKIRVLNHASQQVRTQRWIVAFVASMRARQRANLHADAPNGRAVQSLQSGRKLGPAWSRWSPAHVTL